MNQEAANKRSKLTPLIRCLLHLIKFLLKEIFISPTRITSILHGRLSYTIIIFDIEYVRTGYHQYQSRELESVFLNRNLGTKCQIPARIVDREMYCLIMKMNGYLQC